MDGCNTSFLLGRPIFRCELLVSGRVIDLKSVARFLFSCHLSLLAWLFFPVSQVRRFALHACVVQRLRETESRADNVVFHHSLELHGEMPRYVKR